MAEVTNFRNNALPYPVYGVPWAIVFPLLDADGDPISPSSPDSEVSKNGDTFTDCTNEAVEIATTSGICYLLLTATEMTADIVTVQIKSTGAKTTVITLYPRKLVSIRANTSASAGSSTSTIVLDAGASAVDDFYNGMICVAVIDTLTEVRVISDYTGSSKTCTVVPDWNVAPDNNDTFTIYLPDGVQIQQANASHWNSLATVALPLVPATAGRSLVVDAAGLADANTVKLGPTGSGTAQTARDIGASVLLSSGTGTGQVKIASGYLAITWADVAAPTTTVNLSGTTIATTQKVDVETIKTNPVVNGGTITFPTTATLASTTNITAGTITTVTTTTTATNLTNAPTSGDFTATMKTSIGTAVAASAVASVTARVTANVDQLNGTSIAGTSTRVADSFVTLLNVATPVFTVASVNQTGDSFARIGSAGAGLTAVALTGTQTFNNTGTWTGNIVGTLSTLTTYTGNTPQTGDSFARIGATGSGLTSLAPSSTALSTATWTGTLATNLTTLASHDPGATLGTSTLTQTQVTGGAYSVQNASCVLGDTRIANLDASVTTRMATYTQPAGFLAATFPLTVASTTNITAGTITNVTNLTNAPTTGDFTSTMKTSIGTAVASSAVASVIGNVGGNVAGTVGGIAGTTQTFDALQTALSTAHGAGSWATATGFSTLTSSDVRSAIGIGSANLDIQLAAIDADVLTRLASSSYTAPLSAAGTRGALGMTTNDLDTQLDAILAAVVDGGGGGGAGTGARTVTITVNDGSTVLQNATVRATLNPSTTAVATTNASGVTTLNLDDGTYTIAITLSGYTFAGASLVIAGDTSHTYSMTAISISPSDADKTTAYATVYDEDGVIEPGVTISCKLMSVNTLQGIIFDKAVRTSDSSGSGLVQFANLIKGASYRFWRGDSMKVMDIKIPTDADSTYELPSFAGDP